MRKKRKKMILKSNAIILGISLIAFSPLSFATIYKWEDANHETHYSENPPNNANTTVIKTQIEPSSTAPQEKAKADKLEAQFSDEKKKQLEQEEKAKIEAENAKIRNSNCQQAKAHLADMQLKERVKLIDASGNAVMLTPDQKAAEINRTQEVIKDNCPP